jgi:hypothetical protein
MMDFSPIKRDVPELAATARKTILPSPPDEQVALSLQSCKRRTTGEENKTPMGDRRRHQRFVMSDACEGTFQLLEDVTIEEVTDDELRLLSAAPAKPGEVVSVEIPGETGNGNAVFKGHVTESRPITTDGALRHRVVVKTTAADPSPEVGDELVEENGK